MKKWGIYYLVSIIFTILLSTANKDLQKGINYHRAGKLDDAKKVYEKQLTLNPENSDVYHLLGLIEYQSKNYELAIKLINRAIDINGKIPTYYVNLGAAFQDIGNLHKAEQNYLKALNISPGFFDAERNLALLLFKKNDYDSAFKKYQKLIAQKPNQAEIYFELANAQCMKGDYQDAIQNYHKAIELKPGLAQAHNYLGVALKGNGQIEEAILSCQKSIELDPNNAEVYNNIGNLYQLKSEHQTAFESYEKAISLNSNYPEAYYNLANAVYRIKGSYKDSIDLYKKAIELKPDYVDALNNLANAYKELGNYKLAAESYQNALLIYPEHPELHNNLGNLLQDLKDYENAIKHYQQAIKGRPNYAAAYSNLGNALAEVGIYKDSIECHKKAVEIKPDYAEAYSNLGNSFQALGAIDEAEQNYKKAIELKPDLAETLNNLGTVYKDRGKLSDAIECYKQALEIKKDYPYAYSNLGVSLKSQGRIEEAIEVYRKTIELKPDLVAAHSNLLLTLNYVDTISPDEIFEEHKKWAKRHAKKVEKFSTFLQDFRADRKLKIGYVSSDFKNHSVAFFIEAFLEKYNKDNFEVYCYSGVINPDEVTLRLKSYVDKWINCFGYDDGLMAKRIHDDQIDILVDLSGHTSDNRVLVFARKPAPIQINYVGYPNTSGMQEMDYRIVDEITDPVDLKKLSTEELLRMPNSFLCYSPPEAVPDIKNLPATKNIYITFASFNNLAKISDKVLNLWCNILKQTPNSKLVLKNHSLTDEQTAERYYVIFEERGIDRERIQLYGWIKNKQDHLELYNSVDIALDTFPYNGTTTTCEALLMGVPVVALEGCTHPSRVSASLLKNTGLSELVTESEEDYFKKVLELSTDIETLDNYRKTIRDKLLNSPLCDAQKFTNDLESLYKKIWVRLCEGYKK